MSASLHQNFSCLVPARLTGQCPIKRFQKLKWSLGTPDDRQHFSHCCQHLVKKMKWCLDGSCRLLRYEGMRVSILKKCRSAAWASLMRQRVDRRTQVSTARRCRGHLRRTAVPGLERVQSSNNSILVIITNMLSRRHQGGGRTGAGTCCTHVDECV